MEGQMQAMVAERHLPERFHAGRYLDFLETIEPRCWSGTVTRMTGLLVESRGPATAVGDFCSIHTSTGIAATTPFSRNQQPGAPCRTHGIDRRAHGMFTYIRLPSKTKAENDLTGMYWAQAGKTEP